MANRNKAERNRETEIGLAEFRPLNGSQNQAWRVMSQNEFSMLTGAPGTGKTFLAVSFGVQMVRRKRLEKIVVTRAILEAGRSRLGALPGSVSEKVSPYFRPVFEAMKKLRASDVPLECIPPCHLQGLTIENAFVIVDEAQALTLEELRLVVSRVGKGSRLVLAGDPKQDMNSTQKAFARMLAACDGLEGVGIHQFESQDIVRHELIPRVLERLESA